MRPWIDYHTIRADAIYCRYTRQEEGREKRRGIAKIKFCQSVRRLPVSLSTEDHLHGEDGYML